MEAAKMDTLILLESLDAAIRILARAKQQTASGPNAIYCKVLHAEDHLNREVLELLADPNPEDHDMPF
jgi:hypothetical protein